MSAFVTADLHLDHAKILSFDAPDGRRYVGGTSHGSFYEVKLADLCETIQEHYEMAYLLEKVFTSITQP